MKSGGKNFIILLLIGIIVFLSLKLLPKNITSADGDWKTIQIQDGTNIYETPALVLKSPVASCSQFDIDVDITMNANTSCKNWQIWVRENGTFQKAARFSLPNGSGKTVETVVFDTPVSFDAIAVTPTIGGNYSWSMKMDIRNVHHGKVLELPELREYKAVQGTFQSVEIEYGNGVFEVGAFVFDTPLKNCKSLDLNIDVTMNANTSCKEWQIWVRKNGTFEKQGTLSLPNGSGMGSKTVTFNSPTDIDALTVTPTITGNYSWNIQMDVSNAVCDNRIQQRDLKSLSSSKDELTSEWQTVAIKDEGKEYNIHAMVFNKAIQNCTDFDVAIDVTMHANTSCKEWDIWVRSNGDFQKVGTITLPNGSGYGTQHIAFESPKDFDALSATPTVAGGYSWTISIDISNIITK